MLNKEQWLLNPDNTPFSLQSWQRTVDLLAEVFEAPASFLVQHTQDGYQATIASNQTTNPYPAGIIIPSDANIFCRKIVETGQLLYVRNAKQHSEWDTNPEVHEDGFLSYLGVPVTWPDGTPFGTFCVMDYRETDYTKVFVKLIHQLRDILEADLKLMHAYDQIKSMALTDELTGLYNRRGFLELTEQSILFARRAEHKLGLMYMDIDDFKQVNDDLGHHAGDQVLNIVAQCLKTSIRGSDTAGRLGGDEFAATVAFDNTSDLDKICQRFYRTLAKQVSTKQLPDVQVSIGIVEIDLTKIDLDEMLQQADNKMYQDKKHKKSQHQADFL